MRFIAMLAFLASFAFACSAHAENDSFKLNTGVRLTSEVQDTSGWWACPIEKDLIDRGERGLTIYAPRYLGGDSRYLVGRGLCWTRGLSTSDAIPVGKTGRLVFSAAVVDNPTSGFFVFISEAPHNFRSAADFGTDYLNFFSKGDVAPKIIGSIAEDHKNYWDVVATESVSYEVEYDRTNGKDPTRNLNLKLFFTHFAHGGKNFWCAVRVGATLGLDAEAINDAFLRNMLGSFLGKGAPSVAVSQQ
jgi:hypothetical protein